MSFDNVWEIIVAFFFSAKLHIILALIALDLVLGVAVAIRTKTFELRRIADFMIGMVLPYVLVYLALHIIVHLVVEIESIIGQGVDTVVFLLILAALGASIFENFKMLGINLPSMNKRVNDNVGGAKLG